MDHQDIETAKQMVDGAALTGTVLVVMDLLPAIVAIVTIVWTVIRIYETKTVQKWVRLRRLKKHKQK